LLADRMDLAQADVGDLIVVLQSGAYGLTASPAAFLSHPTPAEVLVWTPGQRPMAGTHTRQYLSHRRAGDPGGRRDGHTR
jgi:hypothetical protein